MKNSMKNFIKKPSTKLPLGIDISQQTLDYCLLNTNDKTIKGIIENTESSILSFLNHYNPKEVYIIAEPTGTYSDKLFELSYAQGFEIHLVNPQRSNQYTKVLGLVNKTDTVAAFVLARMGRDNEIKLPLFQPQDELMKERKQLRMTLNALTKQAQMLGNQIHAMEQRLRPSKKALQALKNSLDAIQQQKQILEEELDELSDQEIKEFKKFAQSVVGIGPKTADLLMIFTNGLKTFSKKSQLPKFVGTIPTTHQSGSSINRRGYITKNGPSILRACLYNAANVAKRFNHACKALYQRLRKNGKAHKVAMIAVINKLLHQVFAVVKSKNLFDNQRYLNKST